MSDPLSMSLWGLTLGAGLVLALAGLAALILAERARGLRSARIVRAQGGAKSSGKLPQASQSDQPAETDGARGSSVARMLRLSAERMAAMLGGEARETAAELASAGYRGRDPLLAYAFAKTVLPLACVVLGVARVLATVPVGPGMILPLGIIIALALGLSKGIDIWVDQKRRKRLTRIRHGFPDLLELLVITAEAGLGPQPALHRVASEMRLSHPDLADEILQMVSELRMTNDRRLAYARLNARVPLPEINVFTQTLDQSDTYGTPFSRAMRTLISETRSNRLVQVEEQAARLPVLMTLPLIFCIMPAVFVVLIGPAALSVIDNILAGG